MIQRGLILLLIFLAFSNNCFVFGGNHLEEIKDRSAAALDWRGEYGFAETGGKNTGMVIDYSITVREADGALAADIDADGFQTSMRLACTVKAAGNKIQLFFKNYREDNLLDIFKPGELLLSLEMVKGKILTYWAAITPQLIAYKSGKVYFVKRTRRNAPRR